MCALFCGSHQLTKRFTADEPDRSEGRALEESARSARRLPRTRRRPSDRCCRDDCSRGDGARHRQRSSPASRNRLRSPRSSPRRRSGSQSPRSPRSPCAASVCLKLKLDLDLPRFHGHNRDCVLWLLRSSAQDMGMLRCRVIQRACLWTSRRAFHRAQRRLVHRCEAPVG